MYVTFCFKQLFQRVLSLRAQIEHWITTDLQYNFMYTYIRSCSLANHSCFANQSHINCLTEISTTYIVWRFSQDNIINVDPSNAGHLSWFKKNCTPVLFNPIHILLPTSSNTPRAPNSCVWEQQAIRDKLYISRVPVPLLVVLIWGGPSSLAKRKCTLFV